MEVVLFFESGNVEPMLVKKEEETVEEIEEEIEGQKSYVKTPKNKWIFAILYNNITENATKIEKS